MDLQEFFEIIDICDPEEFKYFENLAALLEADGYIPTEHIQTLLSGIDSELYGEFLETYFDEFLEEIPDEETDFYVAVENIKRTLLGAFPMDHNADNMYEYAELLNRFRKWYLEDRDVIRLTDGADVSVRDARYDLRAAELLGEDVRYDFRAATTFDAGGYDVLVSDMILNDEYDGGDDGEGPDDFS
ncbi:MAG: hypothetical protein IJH91_09845 [Mogibacterium sp.]|nr:hypothetical protein [Mogibacterium sp.]